MPPPWAAKRETDIRDSGAGSDFLPPNLSSFADPVNNFSPNSSNSKAAGSPSSHHSNDLSLSPHDPEVSDNFTFSPGSQWGSNNFDHPIGDPRVRVDSLQSLPEEDFSQMVNSAYGKSGVFGWGFCNRRRCVLFGMMLMFCGAAVLAVVATAGRGWHWINPFRMHSPPSSSNGAGTSTSAATDEVHPLSVACRPTREHTERRQACADECNNYKCCSTDNGGGANCAKSQKDDCVVFWDLCENELMVEPTAEKEDVAEDADITSDTTATATASIATMKPEELDTLCSKNSLLSTKGQDDCEAACEDHMCCFTLSALEGDGNTCEDDPSKQCDTYKPCGNLIVQEAEEILQDVGNQEEEEEERDSAEEAAEYQKVEEEELEVEQEELEVEQEVEVAEEDIKEAEEVLEEVKEDEKHEEENRGEDDRRHVRRR